MRILVDEDLASRELIRRLRDAFPDDILEPARETSDEEVWQRAQYEGAAILTGNVVDFLRLVTERQTHGGLLLVYRSNDRLKDLRAADIARAVRTISENNPDGIDSQVLTVNDFA